MPYDQFVAHLINAEGYLWEDGATGFYFRDAGMELDHMANTFQVFLGTQVVCAQCHDHPYDAWTQKQYYQQAAYAYGVKTSNPKAGRQLRALGNNQNRKDIDPELKAVARRMTRPLRYRVEERKPPSSSLRITHTMMPNPSRWWNPRSCLRIKLRPVIIPP